MLKVPETEMFNFFIPDTNLIFYNHFLSCYKFRNTDGYFITLHIINLKSNLNKIFYLFEKNLE
jgi:hypothetical protein